MDSLIVWLLHPVDASRVHEIGPLLSWHARLMTLAWGILAPFAVLVARYFKILPGQDWPSKLDSQVWWQAHRGMQIAAAVLSLLALGLVLWAPRGLHDAHWHSVFGWLVLGGCAAQILSGILRGSKGGPTAKAPDGTLRGDHYDMTRHRLLFEALHKIVGYGLLLAAAVCIVLGLWSANAPRWMWIVIAGWWGLLVLTAVVLQRHGRAFDTYQAIWGPDPAHPGNRMRKQGFAMTRPGDDPARWKKGDETCSE